MKLAPRDVAAYLARPDPGLAGLLIHGADAMRVARKRQQAVAALIGPDGAAEMRLDRLQASDLRGDPAALQDAMRARGFFAGPRVVFVEGAGDALAADAGAALDAWAPGDAHLVLSAGALAKGSSLRKLFEGHPKAQSAAIYDDPPDRRELAAMLARAGLDGAMAPDRATMVDLAALAEALDPGEFAQLLDKLAAYAAGGDGPPDAGALAAVAPLSTEAGTDDLIDAVAEGATAALPGLLARLRAQGVAPVALAIAALRHFRTLLSVASHPGGAAQGVAVLRPPVWGPRRTRLQRQAERWQGRRLEEAHGLLVEADLALRSGGATAPQAALIDRALHRVAHLARRR